MNHETIENHQLLVVGLITTSSAANMAADFERQGELADQLELPARIKYQTNPERYLTVLWDWQQEGTFPIMTAVEVTSIGDLPQQCVGKRFPACDFAVFPMAGTAPDLQEPWPQVSAWYPAGKAVNTTAVRRYYPSTGKAELLIPLEPHLRPLDN